MTRWWTWVWVLSLSIGFWVLVVWGALELLHLAGL